MLLRPPHLRFPMPCEAIFGREGPLVLEIGFGNGWYLAHLATQHPTWNLLGAEISQGSVLRAYKRLRREGHRHARLYMGPGRFLVRNVLAPRSLHRVFVNFPDPWPKERHRERRLLGAPFFRLLATRLEEGGALCLTTDHQAYYQAALAKARSTALYDIEVCPPPPEILETKYARKWRAATKPIYHAVFHKTGEPPAAFTPDIETYSKMHHAMLQGSLPTIESFDKLVHSFKGGHVIVLEALRSIGTPGLVFVVRIEEPDLTQELLIEARPAPKIPDGVFIGVKSFSQPLPTRGVRAAIETLTTWLADKGLVVVERFF